MNKAIPVAIPLNDFHTFIEELPESHKRQINDYVKQEKDKMIKEFNNTKTQLNNQIYMLKTQVKILKVYRNWFVKKSGYGNNIAHIVNTSIDKTKNKRHYDSDDYSSTSSSDSEDDPVYNLAEALSNVMKKT
jgi:hypothetical protein